MTKDEMTTKIIEAYYPEDYAPGESKMANLRKGFMIMRKKNLEALMPIADRILVSRVKESERHEIAHMFGDTTADAVSAKNWRY